MCHTVSLFKCLDKTSKQIYTLWPFKHYIKSSSLSLSWFLTCSDRWPSHGPPILSIHLNFDITHLYFWIETFFHHFPMASQPLIPVPCDSTLSSEEKHPYLSRAGDKSRESVTVQHFSLLISGIYQVIHAITGCTTLWSLQPWANHVSPSSCRSALRWATWITSINTLKWNAWGLGKWGS